MIGSCFDNNDEKLYLETQNISWYLCFTDLLNTERCPMYNMFVKHKYQELFKVSYIKVYHQISSIETINNILFYTM